MALKLYNTLSRKKEVFRPLKDKKVGLYVCGPTVYWFAHVGNLRTYIFEDVLKRVLEYNGYRVKHIMNITDVGHLTSEADTGEDKIEIGAKREKKTAWQIAKFYTQVFKKDIKRLNIKPPTFLPRATDHIKEQIELIKILEQKGFTYKIKDGIYFDALKLKTYGRLWPKKMKIKAGIRVEMVPGKKNPKDFALWKFTPAGVKRQMEWNSPWGQGFPGWHTECVVMAVKYLGVPFDIHCGGIDHILIHHTNEIAQSEAAFSKILAKFWLHGEFLTLKGGRMGKSEGNIIILEDLVKKGFNPLAYRYLCLGTHYRKRLTFSWKALKSAQNSYERINELIAREDDKKINKKYLKEFIKAINDDLNMPRALSILWNLLRDVKAYGKRNTAKEMDKVLGLNIRPEIIIRPPVGKIKIRGESPVIKVIKGPRETPKNIIKILKDREKARNEKNWQKADELRQKIKKFGYLIEDTKEGPKINPVRSSNN